MENAMPTSCACIGSSPVVSVSSETTDAAMQTLYPVIELGPGKNRCDDPVPHPDIPICSWLPWTGLGDTASAPFFIRVQSQFSQPRFELRRS